MFSGRENRTMQLRELELPEGWEEHPGYAERMPGVIAAYKTEDAKSGMWFIEVVEYEGDKDASHRVDLLKQVGAEPETIRKEKEYVNGYEEAEEAVLELSEQCN